jgi:hypothetical protein
MMPNLNAQNITKPEGAMCVHVVLTGPVYRQVMIPVSFNLGHKAKGPPTGY